MNGRYGSFDNDLLGIGGNGWSDVRQHFSFGRTLLTRMLIQVDLSSTQPFPNFDGLSPSSHTSDINPSYGIEYAPTPHHQGQYSSSVPTGRAIPTRVPEDLGLTLDTTYNPTSRSTPSLPFLQQDFHPNTQNTPHTPGLTQTPSISLYSDELSSVVSSEQDSYAGVVCSPGGSPSPVLGDDSHSPSGSFLHPKWSANLVSRGKKRKQINTVAEPHGSNTTKIALAPQSTKPKSKENDRSLCDICLETFSMPADKDRHMRNYHAEVFGQSTKWVCDNKTGIIPPKEKWPRFKPLGDCKRCSTNFRYNASHNAEEHLRRKHFHPREPGSRPRSDSERRGGKGGGRDPDVHYLKEFWLQKIDICHKVPCQCQLLHEPLPPQQNDRPRRGSRSQKAPVAASARSSVSDSSLYLPRRSSNASGSDGGSPMEGLSQSQPSQGWCRSPNLSAASSDHSPAQSSSLFSPIMDLPSSVYQTNQGYSPYSPASHPSLLQMQMQLGDYDQNESCVFPANSHYHGYEDPNGPSWPGL